MRKAAIKMIGYDELANQRKEPKMKTRKWSLLAIGLLATLGVILGAGFADAGWFSSSTVSAESVSDEGSTAVEVRSNDTGNPGIELAPENINQILRDHEALNVRENPVLELESENINQILREYEALNASQDELDDDLLQRQMRFNLPEGIN
jgi:hypothetical protein